MRFGVALPYNQTRNIARWARLAEEAGWDGLFLGDAIWTEDPMIALAAAATATERIRLGTMLIPVPLRRPWKIASEAVALDLLSDGRLTLGLGSGATWMGWQSFPDEVTDNHIRAEMLDETIDILTLFFERRPFDYEGKHYHLKLSLLAEEHGPPKPVQQPRIPLWVPLIWPRRSSMQRILKCDGMFTEKLSIDGRRQEVTPEDLRQMKSFVDENRTLTTPIDIVIGGKRVRIADAKRREEMSAWMEAGATWWIEELLGDTAEAVTETIRQGPPDAA